MRGIPGEIGGNSMSIPPKICPGVGDFPRFSVIIMIAPGNSSQNSSLGPSDFPTKFVPGSVTFRCFPERQNGKSPGLDGGPYIQMTSA